jgi:hypothetical protein
MAGADGVKPEILYFWLPPPSTLLARERARARGRKPKQEGEVAGDDRANGRHDGARAMEPEADAAHRAAWREVMRDVRDAEAYAVAYAEHGARSAAVMEHLLSYLRPTCYGCINDRHCPVELTCRNCDRAHAEWSRRTHGAARVG